MMGRGIRRVLTGGDIDVAGGGVNLLTEQRGCPRRDVVANQSPVELPWLTPIVGSRTESGKTTYTVTNISGIP
jgi:hypothetical protein